MTLSTFEAPGKNFICVHGLWCNSSEAVGSGPLFHQFIAIARHDTFVGVTAPN